MTLFNSRRNNTELRENAPLSPESDEFSINFIKPKLKAPVTNSTRQVEKSKLSLMLSYLTGDFEDDDPKPSKIVSIDQVDNKEREKEIQSNTSSNFTITTASSEKAPIATLSFSTNAMKSNVPVREFAEKASPGKPEETSEVKGKPVIDFETTFYI